LWDMWEEFLPHFSHNTPWTHTFWPSTISLPWLWPSIQPIQFTQEP